MAWRLSGTIFPVRRKSKHCEIWQLRSVTRNRPDTAPSVTAVGPFGIAVAVVL
jgi:hypothetical protein